MQSKAPRPEHYSYLRYRRQRTRQIILPVVVSAFAVVLTVILISLPGFQSGGEVARPAAIATIWLAILTLLGGLIVLALLLVLVYGMQLALDAIPYYTEIAQNYVYAARGYIVRAANAVSNAVIQFEGVFADIQSFFQRIKP